MKRIKVFLIVLFIILSVTALKNHTIEAENIEKTNQGIDLFFEGRDLYQSMTNPGQNAKNKLLASKEFFMKLENNFFKYYWLARVQYYLAGFDEEKNNGAGYKQSIEWAQKALEYKISSDAYRIQADSYLDLVPYVGIFKQISYGKKAKELLIKALKTDSNNYNAYKSLGGYYIHAPKLMGGDIEQGIKLVLKSLKSKDKVTKYVAYVLLANAYDKKEDLKEEIKYVEKAVQIFPDRSDTKKWLKNLRAEEEN